VRPVPLIRLQYAVLLSLLHGKRRRTLKGRANSKDYGGTD